MSESYYQLTQRERELLLQLLQSIDADALASVFDSVDAITADMAKAKVMILLEDGEL